MSKKLQNVLRQNKNKTLATLLIIAFLMGAISIYDSETGKFDIAGLGANLATEIIGGVMLFWFIDSFFIRYEDETTARKTLIRQLENQDKNLVQQAVNQLRARGWLEDGSFYEWFLKHANFEDIDLKDANFNGLGLYRCNLTNAQINEAQLVKMRDLRFTIMPNGKIYDGRYCLVGDIDWAKTQHNINFMEAPIEKMAEYYGVSVEEFLQGQQWAYDNLHTLRGEVPPYLKKLALTWAEKS